MECGDDLGEIGLVDWVRSVTGAMERHPNYFELGPSGDIVW